MKKLVFVSLILLSFSSVKAQSAAASLSRKFETYQALWPRTVVHLVLNQDKFSPGDTAYFKAYFLKADFSPVAGKQLIDLNLVNAKGESLFHLKFDVVNGIGQNQLVIPESLSPGVYVMTAHSSWMENFDPAYIFRKEILIVAKNAVGFEGSPLLSAVAEGGHLISDLPSNVAVRTTRAGASLQVIDGSGHEVGRTTTNSLGAGTLVLTPAKSASYFVRLLDDSARMPLPRVENDGCSLILTPTRPDNSLKIEVRSPAGSSRLSEKLVIIASGRGKIYYASEFQLESNGIAVLRLAAQDFPEGIVHVSLLTQSGNVLASRDFYNPGRNSVNATMNIDRHSFQPREKARIDIALTDSNGQPVQGEFSVKAVNKSLFESEQNNSIIKAPDFWPGLGHGQTDSIRLKELNDYLITATEAVPWANILSGSTTKPRFSFSNFVQKKGTVSFASGDKPVPDFMDIIFYLQRTGIRYQTTVEKGRVWLAIPNLIGEDELFFAAETFYYLNGVKHGSEVSGLKIEWDPESFQLPKARAGKELDAVDRYASFAAKRKLMERSYGYYNSSGGDHSGQGAARYDIETEAKPDVSMNIEDYVIFPTLAEMIKEIIPFIQLRKERQKNKLLINLSESMWAQKTGNPVYVIDGVATKNTEFFLSLKPADLISIKIISDARKLERFGLMGKNGIVIVHTKKGDVREPLDDPSKLIEGVSKPTGFKMHDYSRANDVHRPDFKSTLYWNPLVKTDENGKATVEFYCSDDIGTFEIRIDGMANGGKAFMTEGNIEVILSSKP